MNQEYYYITYNLIIVVFFLLNSLLRVRKKNISQCAVLFIFLLSIFVGCRPFDLNIDTIHNISTIQRIEHIRSFSEFISDFEFFSEPLLYSIYFIFTRFAGVSVIFWVISLISLSLTFHFCIKICNVTGSNSPFLLFLTYLISFYIGGQQYQIIRSGLMMSFLLNYYFYLFTDKRKQAAFWGGLAFLSHITSVIGIFGAIMVKVLKLSERKYIIIFFVAIIIAYMGLGLDKVSFLAGADIEKVQGYLSGKDTAYNIGFRPSFVLFNTLFLIVFYYLNIKHNQICEYLFTLYIVLSIVLFLSFNIPYFDRIGAFSWNLIPIITYLYLMKRNPKNQKFYGNMSFLFMFLIKNIINIFS